jgi:hypothetical protein
MNRTVLLVIAVVFSMHSSLSWTAPSLVPSDTEKRALAILGDMWHCVAPLNRYIVREIEGFGYRTDVVMDQQVPFESLDAYEIIVLSKYAWDDARRFRERVHGTPAAKNDEMRWLTPEQEDLLEAWVENGGRLLLHHAGIGYYRKYGGIHRLSKAFFIKHPPVTTISLRPTGTMPDLMEGVVPFVLEDEEYEMEFDESQTTVFLESKSEANGRFPQGWAHDYGAGKVVVFVPGHDMRSLSHPMVGICIRRIIQHLSN